MPLTRRDLLSALAAAAVIAHPAVSQAAQAAWPGSLEPVPPTGPAAPTRDEFESQINQLFRVNRPGQPAYGLNLAAVRDAAAAERSGRVGSQAAFTVLFVGPAADPLPEGTYGLTSGTGAAYMLFLKRGGVVNGLRCYEAAFNNPETLDRTFGG